jgi:hypothetical protein
MRRPHLWPVDDLTPAFALIQYHDTGVQTGDIAFSGIVILLLLDGYEFRLNGFFLFQQLFILPTVLHMILKLLVRINPLTDFAQVHFLFLLLPVIIGAFFPFIVLILLVSIDSLNVRVVGFVVVFDER